jgi:hypothetical protein
MTPNSSTGAPMPELINPASAAPVDQELARVLRADARGEGGAAASSRPVFREALIWIGTALAIWMIVALSV